MRRVGRSTVGNRANAKAKISDDAALLGWWRYGSAVLPGVW
ncbi:hypothetical protein ABT348_19870 [Streptomyces olivaceus]